jgi:LAO/AO transport system kinase
MEMADAIVINKADGDNIKRANLAKLNLIERYICSLPKNQVGPTTAACSAITNEGISAVWELFKILGTDERQQLFL